MVKIRKYRPEDLGGMAALFRETVRTVCANDYSEKEREAWASADTSGWDASFRAHDTLVAEEEGILVGFADMAEDGYLDRLYVHKDHQRRGIASALCGALEERCRASVFTVHASKTARPFFEKRGYTVAEERTVVRKEVTLVNYKMEKSNEKSTLAEFAREDLLRAAEERHSVRRYADRAVAEDAASLLSAEAEKCAAEGGICIRLLLGEEKAFGGLMAHYGKFSGVRNYFLLGGKKSADLEEKVGYFGERLVLLAQALGLNTCWVALTFSKKAAKKAAGFAKGEKPVCAIALGYGETQGVPHRGKSPEELCRGENLPEWFLRGVGCAANAPTAMNQQKFSFSLKDDGSVSAERGRGFYTAVDLGIAKYHFELGAGQENFTWSK